MDEYYKKFDYLREKGALNQIAQNDELILAITILTLYQM
jgi:hypothetical protein